MSYILAHHTSAHAWMPLPEAIIKLRHDTCLSCLCTDDLSINAHPDRKTKYFVFEVDKFMKI